jgi:hypothetical protein
MESWPSLPDAALDASGPHSEAFLRIGCGSYRSAARYLHELPYGRNSDRSEFRLVLSERRGTCSTKHALLAAVALEQGLPVSIVIGIYDMTGRRVDITRSGIAARAPIARFHREWSIEPEEIGAHKLALHRQYLLGWLRERRDLRFSLEELWRIREACILALAAPGA